MSHSLNLHLSELAHPFDFFIQSFRSGQDSNLRLDRVFGPARDHHLVTACTRLIKVNKLAARGFALVVIVLAFYSDESSSKVVALLAKQLLHTPDVRGSQPVIGEFSKIIYCQLYWKDKNKQKRGRGCHTLDQSLLSLSLVRVEVVSTILMNLRSTMNQEVLFT